MGVSRSSGRRVPGVQTDPSTAPDDVEELEARFAEAARNGDKVSAWLRFDPAGEAAELPPLLMLRRDAEAFPQIFEHIRREAGGRPGTYQIKLKRNGKHLAQVTIPLLFAGAAPGETPRKAPENTAETPWKTPALSGLGSDDYARDVGRRLIEKALENALNPPQPPPEEDEEDDGDEGEDEDDDQLTGLGKAVFKLGEKLLDSDDGKAVVGDFFSAMTDERRARAKKLEAEAQALLRAIAPPSSSSSAQLAGEKPAASGVAEVLKFRVVGGGEASGEG